MFKEQKDQLNKLLRLIEDNSISTTIKDTLNGLEKIDSYLTLNPDIEKKLIEPEQRETVAEIGTQNEQAGNVLPPDNPFFEFERYAEGYEIVRYRGSDQTEIEIPAYHQDLPVVRIGEEVFQDAHFKTVIMGQNLRSLGKNAFFRCRQLEKVIRGEVVTFLEAGVFFGCKKLSKFDLSPNIVFMDKYVFSFTSLKSVTIPESLPYIRKNTFYMCTELVNVRFSANLQVIEEYAFYGCSSLKSVEIPKSVYYIGKEAFANCDALKKCYSYGMDIMIGPDVFTTSYAFQPDKRYKVRYLERPNPLLTVYGRSGSSIQDYCMQAGIEFKRIRKACSIPEPTRKPFDKWLRVYPDKDRHNRDTLNLMLGRLLKILRKDAPYVLIHGKYNGGFYIFVDESLTKTKDTMDIISKYLSVRGCDVEIIEFTERDYNVSSGTG